MFLDASGQAPQGLVTTLVLFLIFLGLMRIGTRASEARIRIPAFVLGWLLLTLAAFLRAVGHSHLGGGADAPSYRRQFESSEGAMGRPHMPDSGAAAGAADPLYLGLVRVVRMFTDDYHIYFFIVHGLITFGIVFFIAKMLKAEHPILPLLFIFPSWLYSLSAMRNWMAIALFLVALTFYARKRILPFYIWALIAVGFHLATILFLGFPLVAYIFNKLQTTLLKILFVVLINIAVFSASDLLTRVFSGARFEQYLSWDPASPLFMAPFLAIIWAGMVFAYRSEALDEQSHRLVLFAVFVAGLTTLILYFGGFRYKEFAVVPLAVVASYTLYAIRTRFTSDLLSRIFLSLAVYATLYVEASSRLQSVINLSGVFPLTWFES